MDKFTEEEKKQEEDSRPCPPRRELLVLEIEGYEAHIKVIDKYNAALPKGKKKEDAATPWMEVALRKEMYRNGTGIGYTVPLDASRVEKASLIKVFAALKGDVWTKKFGWVGQPKTVIKPEIKLFEPAVSLFQGITTVKFAGTCMVSGIDLSGIGCEGILPPQIADFETCRFLHLNWNLIAGNLPRDFGTLRSLESLCLSGNELQGKLDPDSFSSLENLRVLDLSHNRFEGEIPDCFASMSKLVELNLSNNMLVGPLPRSMSSLLKLQVLKLFANGGLSGALPTWLSLLVNLREVDFSRNVFQGSIEPFVACVKLQKLVLNNNSLTGRLAPSLSQLTALQILYLQRNKLHGRVPDEICALTSLRRLNISSNNFRGTLPPELGRLLPSLESLILTDNAFIGPLPPTLSLLTNLKDFYVFRSYPSESFTQQKGFVRHEFERVHAFGPACGLNSITWEFSEDPKGAPNPSRSRVDEDPFTLFEKYHPETRSHKVKHHHQHQHQHQHHHQHHHQHQHQHQHQHNR